MSTASGSYSPVYENGAVTSSATPFLETITSATSSGGLGNNTTNKVTGNFSIEAIDKILISLPTTPTPKWMVENYSPDVISKMLERVKIWTDDTTSEDPKTLDDLTMVSSNITSKAPMALLENLGDLTTVTPQWLTDNLTSEDPSRLLNNLTTKTTKWLLDNQSGNETDIPSKDPVNDTTPFYFKFRHEPLIYQLLAIAAFNILAIIVFDVYILYKSCGSKRHLIMGQVLLFVLFLGSVLGLVYVPQPHWLFCGITRVCVGLVYATIFAALFVKCLFLLKLHHGVYLSASIQALFLFFVVAIEVAIVTQWSVYDPPHTIPSLDPDHPEDVCSKTPLEKIEYLCYVMFLMLLVIIAAIRARYLRENNREARFIGITIGICLIIWVAWISVSLVFDRRYEAPAEAFGLVCTCSIVILLIFIPKAVNLATAMDVRNGSSGSRSVLNTPSFLHLQPHAIIPVGGQDTIVKQTSLNADFCRNYSSRMWRYGLYPSFHEMEPPVSDNQSLKKSNFSSSNSRLY